MTNNNRVGSKLRKICATLLAATSCCSMFAACGTTDTDTKPTPTPDPGPGTSLPTLTENTDFAALVSDKVTEAEWKTAFAETSFSNCTIKNNDIVGKVNYDGDPILDENGKQVTYIRSYVLNIDKTAERDYRHNSIFHITDGQKEERISGEQSHWSYENKVMTGYWQGQDPENPQAYYKATANYDDYSSMPGWTAWSFSYKMVSPDFGNFFDSFSYDEALHAYVCKDKRVTTNMSMQNWECEHDDIVIKIVSGRLAYIYSYQIMVDPDGNEYMPESPIEIFFYDYGTTQVTMPTSAIEYVEDKEDHPPYEE